MDRKLWPMGKQVRTSRARHRRRAAVDDALFELEVRYAVPQQPAGLLAFLEDRDAMAGAGELLGGGEARGALLPAGP
jgi:hypothetical protein